MYYVVVRNHFEYDDEGYHGSYDGQSYDHLKKVFKSRAKAEAMRQELERNEFRDLNPYEYEPYRNSCEADPIDTGVALCDDDKETYYYRTPNDMDDETTDKYIAAFPLLRFWEVIEVE